MARGRRAVPIEERFWKFVDKDGPDGCWNWTGFRSRGYGLVSLDGRNARAYRVAYELLVGPIPDGLVLDHLCRNPSCVNPDHLEPVPQRINVHRGARAKLSIEIAQEIRQRILDGAGYEELVDEYGISNHVLWRIAEDRTWRVDPDAPRDPLRPIRNCRLCGVQITDGHRHKLYCCAEHRKEFNWRIKTKKFRLAREAA